MDDRQAHFCVLLGQKGISAAQAFKKEANVRIGSIELRAAGAPAPKTPAKKK